MAKYHLAILKKPYLDAIFEGTKTVESRFMKIKRSPFGDVNVGDILFLKLSSGPVCGKAKVKSVKNFEDLSPEKIARLRADYNHLIRGDDEVWKMMEDRKFAVLIWLEDIKRIEPIYIQKKDWRAWVALKKGRDFGLIDGLY